MKATPTIEFTFESPCPGQLENVVALDVEGEAAPRSASTRAHLAGCPRCRAFRDSLKTQASYVKRWYAANPVPGRCERSSARRDAVREDLGLTPWLDDALSVRSERALATDLWRCAAAVYRMDPEVDRKTVFVDAVVRKTPRTAIQLAMESMLRGWHRKSPGTSRNAANGDAIRAQARSLVDGIEKIGRLSVVSRLLAISDQLVTPPISKSLLLQSEVDWHYGDQKRVTSLLEMAYRCSARPIDRHNVMNNLAVWSFKHHQIRDAEQLALRAIDASPDSIQVRMNLAIWSLALGNRQLGDSLLSSTAKALEDGAVPWSTELTCAVVAEVEAVLDRPPSSLRFIVDRVFDLASGRRLRERQKRVGAERNP
jgi:hypothetical protein